ncbi:Lrp/AsnC family transcriptional regulator [Acinetobacter sp. B5B]|uniref:Lrp/AsnC family transcriptional regulator n=1 Tax=Acinetobacter baretiae TaxID=2605383 RepID=UPI0018C207DF|nr:Lrp/AsnC family transcriptional regulator [Acinetobacter baretiae]MBF7684137.1 Lrp/AsnC family transcriptional regulator [Acinetobacter baretiae]
MDNIDKKILSELQLNGRLSITELAEKVGLSLSPCHRRLRTLEDSGIIKGYSIQLEENLIGLSFSTIVFVTMKNGDKKTISHFEEAISNIAHIIQAQRLFGDPDYLLHVVVKDLISFQKLYDRKLSSLPGVQRLTSTLVMKNVISNRILPINFPPV